MPWRRSLSNPRKVYNERHEQVCICETPEQAALIVEAVRAVKRAEIIPQIIPADCGKPGYLTDPAEWRRTDVTSKSEPDDDGSFAIV